MNLHLTTDPQSIRFSTASGDVVQWRLEIVNQQDQPVYDSQLISGTSVTWPLVDSQGQAVDSGIYAYTLSVRDVGRERSRQGQLFVQKTVNGHQVSAVSDRQAALAGNGETMLTISAGGATESAPTGSGLPRSLGGASFAAAVTGYISGTGTTNAMTKWFDGPGGVVGDTAVSEYAGAVTIGNGTYYGNLQIFGAASYDVFAGMGPNLVTGPGFNFGYAGASFGRSAGFFNVRPDASAVAPNPSLRFMTANVQRMIITNEGKVGIGTSSPNQALEVQTAISSAAIRGEASGSSIYGVSGLSSCCTGVVGSTAGQNGVGVQGTSPYIGVYGTSDKTGVFGASIPGSGVTGHSYSGAGVTASTVIGNLVEGFTSEVRKFHITNTGTYVAGSDFAEALPAEAGAEFEAGDVLVLSDQTPGGVATTTRQYDTRVVGVYSTRPGLLGAEKGGTSRVDPTDVPVAIMGIVPTKVSAENGPIRAGDLLTTSSTPGHAMKASPTSIAGVTIYPAGTILGKALEPLTEARGVIRVLVTLK